jgi:hypothetical protein
MAKDVETVKTEIEELIREKCIGKFYSDYSIGITKNPKERVFSDHKVDRNKCHWIFESENKKDSCEIESYFIKKGMKGGVGGNIDDKCVYVYVYRITEHTVEAPKLEYIDESIKIDTVEVYSGKSEFVERFYKVRVIGKHQLDGYWFEKDDALKIASKEKDRVKGELKISSPEGKL